MLPSFHGITESEPDEQGQQAEHARFNGTETAGVGAFALVTPPPAHPKFHSEVDTGQQEKGEAGYADGVDDDHAGPGGDMLMA